MSLNAQGLDHLVENHTSLLRKRIKTIARRQEEIAFYISMLQRYVAGCKSDMRKLRGEPAETLSYPETERLQ